MSLEWSVDDPYTSTASHRLLYCWVVLYYCSVAYLDLLYDYMGMSTIWIAVDMLWHIVLYSIRISCSIWPVLTLWMQVENRMRYIMYICHCYDCIHLYVYIWFYILYFRDRFPSHQTLCLTRVFVYIVYVDNSRVLSTSSLELGVDGIS